MTPVML